VLEFPRLRLLSPQHGARVLDQARIHRGEAEVGNRPADIGRQQIE